MPISHGGEKDQLFAWTFSRGGENFCIIMPLRVKSYTKGGISLHNPCRIIYSWGSNEKSNKLVYQLLLKDKKEKNPMSDFIVKKDNEWRTF